MCVCVCVFVGGSALLGKIFSIVLSAIRNGMSSRIRNVSMTYIVKGGDAVTNYRNTLINNPKLNAYEKY